MQIPEITNVPLAGPGVAFKPSENYIPGEYRELVNTVITLDGTLVKRPPVQGLMHPKTVNADRFIGSRFHQALINSYNKATGRSRLLVCGDTSVVTLADTASFSTALAAKSSFENPASSGYVYSYTFDGYVRYGDKDYFIVCHTGMSTVLPNENYMGERQYHIASKKTDIRNITAPAEYLLTDSFSISNPLPVFNSSDDIVPANLTNDHISWGNSSLTASNSSEYLAGNNVGYPSMPLSSFLIHKDRLVLSVFDTVFLSKAADFNEFGVANDGAFFKFPGKNIKKILAIQDTIYVIFDSSISAITYNNGPNIDAEVRVISEVVGGEDATIYGDTVYILNSKTLYSINGLNISKLIDLRIDLFPHTNFLSPYANFTSKKAFFSLVAYNDALYICSSYKQYVEAYNLDLNHPHAYGHYSLRNHIYRVSLVDGHVSKFNYNSNVENFVGDLIFVPFEDSYGQSRLVLLGNDNILLTSPSIFYHGQNLNFQTPSVAIKDVQYFNIDSYSNYVGDSLTYHAIRVLIWISSFTPDELEYFYKRFRSVLIEGNFPEWRPDENTAIPELEFLIFFGSSLDSIPLVAADSLKSIVRKELKPVPVETTELGSQSYTDVRGFRFGLNQRAKAVDLVIRSKTEANTYFLDWFGIASNEVRLKLKSSVMEISDISFVWTPVQRGPANRPNSKS